MKTLLALLALVTRSALYAKPPGGPSKPPDGNGPGKPSDGQDRPSQRSGSIDASKSVDGALDAADAEATLGTPGGQGKPTTPNTPNQSGHTRPSGQPDPNAKPGGTPTDTTEGSTKRREGHRIENDSATVLARAGYKISQNTGERGLSGTSYPDYNMEGKLWDCYAPSSPKRDQVRKELRDKAKEQAGSIVINMERSPMTLEEMKALLPHVKGLQEVKIIDRDGNIIDAFPQ